MKKIYRITTALFSLLLLAISANAQLGQLWGVIEQGGTNNGGVLYYFDAGSGKDSILYNFPAGAYPEGTPIQAKNGMVYGVTQAGGSSSDGSVYEFNPLTGAFTTLASFTGGNGSSPNCTLIQSVYDGNLYGTAGGGTSSDGVVFEYNIGTATLTDLFNFSGAANGKLPGSGLIEQSSGTFYGTTEEGGASSLGNIYRFVVPGNTYTNVFSFTGGANGSTPWGALVYNLGDGDLYGMTQGASNGVLFKCTTGGGYSVVTSFTGGNGANPKGSLILVGGVLYGECFGGGANSDGDIFKSPTAGPITDLYDFTSAGLEDPTGNLLYASDGNFYSVCNAGGTNLTGGLFKCTTGGAFTSLLSFTGPNGKVPNHNASVMELMSANIKATDAGCSTQTLTAMVRGSVAPLTYSWSTSGTTSSISASAAGTYSVTVTDSRGIAVTGSITLSAYAATSASAVVTNVTCNGAANGVVMLTPTGGDGPYTFSWDNSATTGLINGLTPGNYTYTITDVSGCTSSATETVTQPGVLTVTVSGTNAICNGGSTSLTATPSGGTAPDGYVWTPTASIAVPTGSVVTATPTTTTTYSVIVTDANNCTATTTYAVTVNSTPTVSATSTSPVCSGSTLSFTGTGSGITSWAWAGPNTFNSTLQNPPLAGITTIAAGTYTLTGTNANGCSGSATTVVTVNTTPTVSVTPGSSTICAGSNSSLSASGASSYSWSPGISLNVSTGAGVIATPTATTTYTVTGTGAAGCTSIATVVVTVNALPTVNATTNSPVCSNSNLTLTGTGVGVNSWVWQGPNTFSAPLQNTNIPNATTAATGTYTLSVTGTNGCLNSGTTSVTVNATPTVTAVAGTPTYCNGGNTSLTASGATNYTWAPSTNLSVTTGASIVATPTTSITYTVTGASAAGCTSTGTASVTVNALPTVTASATLPTICNGANTNLTASGASNYTWSPGSSLSVTTGSSVIATPTATTIYTVTGTNAAGCMNTATVTVTVNALPTVTASASASPVCVGTTTNLTANGASSFTWTPSATLSVTTGVSVIATPTTATTYTVTGTSAAGCTNTGTVTVSVNALPTITASAGSSSVCLGSSTALTSSGANTYTWAPAVSLSPTTGASVNATPTTLTTYTVTGTNSSGCVNTATVSVSVNALPVVGASSNSPVCAGGQLMLTGTGTGISSWYWSGANFFGSTGQNPFLNSVTTAATGSYTLTGTDANGCQGSSTISVTINPLPTVTASASASPICAGSTSDLTASGANSYTWSPSSSLSTSIGANVVATPTTPTTYTVTGTNAAGCMNTATAFVSINSLPSMTGSASPSTICAEGFSTLATSGANSYAWAPATGLSATTGASVVANPTNTITYTVTGTNSATGCQNTEAITVTVNSLPTIILTPGSSAICSGSSTNITASGAITYAWSPSTGLSATIGASVNTTLTTSNTYTVTGTDGNGCVNSQSIPITALSLPSVTATAGTPTICLGSNTSLTASGASTYVWSPSGSLSSSVGASVSATPTVNTTYSVTGTNANGCQNSTTVAVTIDEPVVVLQTTNASCFGSCNGTGLANVSGGTSPYTYIWSNGQSTHVSYGLCANTYTLTVKDVIGCSNTQPFTITQPVAISLSAVATSTTCGLANGTATATPSGGSAPYNYSWTTKPAQTNDVATGLASGTYSVTTTDRNGCTATQSVTVNGSSGPAIASTKINQSSCGTSDGNATITVTGGTSPYAYSWNNGSISAGDSNLAAGTYIATVTDNNGCSTFEAISINDASGPSINVTSVTEISCYGSSGGAISTTITGGTSPYQYSWSNSATTESISGLTAGPYQFTVSDANGCTAVQTVNITQPTQLLIVASTTQANCASTDGSVSVTASGGTAPYIYLWNTGITNSSITSLGAGTYSVTVTDNDGCSSTALASISNNSGPLVTIDSVVGISCATGTAGEITETANGGTPPFTYLWSNGSNTPNIYGLAAGNYALTVTDANGCVGTANATIIQSTLDTISICMVTVDPATNYNNLLWNQNMASAKVASYNIYKETTTPGVFGKIGSSPAGTGVYVDVLSDARKRSWRYELSQVDSCGNESPLSKPFKTMHLTINPGSNYVNLIWDNFQGIAFDYYIIYRDSIAGVAIDSVDYVTNNGIYTYTDYPSTSTNWYYHMGISGGVDCSIAKQKPHSIETVNYNASKSNTGNVTFVGPTAVDNIASLNSVDVYPNPNTGIFTLSVVLAKDKQNIGIRVLNMMGQVLWSESYNNASGNLKKQIDLSDYSKGVYLVQITTDSGIMYRKVTIQ